MGRNDYVNEGCTCVTEHNICDACCAQQCDWCHAEYECDDCGMFLCEGCSPKHVCEDAEPRQT